MNKKRIKQKVVEEEVDRPLWEQEALEIFQAAGWGDDAGWLSAFALAIAVDPADREEAPDEAATHQLRAIAQSWRDAGPLPDRDRALLMVYVRICGCGGKGGFLGESLRVLPDGGFRKFRVTTTPKQRRLLATEFRRRRADFEGALVRTGWPGDYSEGDSVHVWLMDRQRGVEATGAMPDAEPGCPALVPLMRLLVEDAGLDLLKVLDPDELLATAVNYWPRDFGASAGQWPPDMRHRLRLNVDSPRSIEAWVAGLGPNATLCLLHGLENRTDEQLAGVALGARRIIEEWLFLAVHDWTQFSRAGGVLGLATHPWFELLHRRAVAAGAAACPALRRAWLWFAWCTFDADREAWIAHDEAVKKAVLLAATEEISRARKIFARAGFLASLPPENPSAASSEPERPAAEEFAWGYDLLFVCSNVLFEFGGVWRGLKPMLLAWRALTAPAVAKDLRYWHEPGHVAPPGPWSVLVLWPITMFHHVVGREQALDPMLAKFRGQIASFCLERLTDRLSEDERKAGKQRTNADMVEPSPDWRYCLIRAASSLGVNPEGKGHRILHKCMEIDPDDDVREAAKDGYERLRRNVGLPDGVSPRRAVMSALWWLRQAHLLGLGIEPDRDGAQRTRIKELTRTKESEQRDALPPDQES